MILYLYKPPGTVLVLRNFFHSRVEIKTPESSVVRLTNLHVEPDLCCPLFQKMCLLGTITT